MQRDRPALILCCSAVFRINCPAANRHVSASPARWSSGRTFSFWTSRPRRSMFPFRRWCSISSICPALTSFITLSAREGADGQAVVCPLLRGRSPTRGVAPKQHRGLRRAFSPAFFGLVLFIPWRVGAEEFGAAKDGFGRRDAARRG